MNDAPLEESNPVQKASAVRRAHQAELMAKPNVVGVGIGYRWIAGQRTETVALVVMVTHKLPPDALTPEDVIPPEIDGVPVDVQEVGQLSAQG